MGKKQTKSTAVGSASGKAKRPFECVRIYFNVDKVANTSTCKVDKCRTVLQGRHTSNLLRHLRAKHSAQYQSAMKGRTRYQQDRRANECKCRKIIGRSTSYMRPPTPHPSPSPSPERPATPTSPMRPPAPFSGDVPVMTSDSYISIPIDQAYLIDACVELITVNGWPPSALEDSGFKKLLDPIISTLRSKGNAPNFCINRNNIRDFIHIEAERLREDIKKEIRGKMVCMKVDAAPYIDRSVLSVNAQFCSNGRIVLRNLNVFEIRGSQSAENLRNKLSEILEQFEISPDQIYAITTDNAASTVKPVTDAQPLNQDKDSEEILACNVEPQESTESWTTASECSQLFAELPKDIESKGLVAQRCAVHMLHLAVRNGLENWEKVIDVARELVKKMSNPDATKILLQIGYSRPLLDVKTRWYSTHDMLKNLIAIKDVCSWVLKEANLLKESEAILPSEREWLELKEIAITLTPAKVAIAKMQSQKMIIGDFLAAWLRCKMQMKELTYPLAKIISTAMEQSEDILFQSDNLVAGIFLDPRFRVLLTAFQKKRAEDHLTCLWNKIQVFENATNTAACSPALKQTDDILETMLRRKEAVNTSNSADTSSDGNIQKILQDFSTKRLPIDSDVLLFWEHRKNSDPELYKLATTVLAIPMSQASIEMTFSNLWFILNILRSHLSPKEIDDIMIVRYNRIFKNKESIR